MLPSSSAACLCVLLQNPRARICLPGWEAIADFSNGLQLLALQIRYDELQSG